MPLIDATAYAVDYIPPARGAEWIFHQLKLATTPLNVAVDPEASVPVRANHGRWIVDCPDCHNAQLASRTDHRFMCNECGNVAVGKLWRPVVWPEDADRIEALLVNRPREYQNWLPGESREVLAMENLEYTGKVR